MSNIEAIRSYREAVAAATSCPSSATKREATRQRDAIMKANDGLVWRIAKRTLGARAGNTANLEEAVQEGRIGLMRAIEEFDEAKGQFSTYASFWIRHHVQNCMHHQVDFAKQRSACMPPKAAKAVTKFRTLHGREPERHEVEYEARGKVVNPTPEQWASWHDTAFAISVEDMGAGLTGEGEYSRTGSHELLADESTNPDATVAAVNLRERLSEEMATMSPRNRAIVQALFIDGEQLVAVADKYGVAHSRVHQIKSDLEKRLRKVLAA